MKKIPFSDYRFSVITYETDVYSSGPDIQDEEIAFLKERGYQLVVRNVRNENNPFEDWWIDPNIVSDERWKPYKTWMGSNAEEVILK